jgi:hypothetical protein
MAPTTFPGAKTNTSQFTVDHAGLKAVLLLLLIDSTFLWVTKTQLQSLLALRQLSTVKQEAHVKVAILVVSTNSLMSRESQIHLASNT